METKTVELNEAQGELAQMVAQAASGTEIVLTEGARRVPGLHPGSMEASDDFDAPLPEELLRG